MLRFTIPSPPATSPDRPRVRAGVARVFNGYTTDTPVGRVLIEAWPHRGMTQARAIARRIHRDAQPYLWCVRTFNVPGVVVVGPADRVPAATAVRIVVGGQAHVRAAC